LGRRIPLDALHGCETHSLESHLQSKEQPEATESETRRARRLGDDSRGIAAQQAMCSSVPYREAETTDPATGRATSSELHRVTSGKLQRKNDQ
jgi:hypothetical protein